MNVCMVESAVSHHMNACRAKQQGFRLCILYCPYDGVHDRIGSIQELMKWAEPYEAGSRVCVWQGWDAPEEWVDGMGGNDTMVMGVALLSAQHAEVPISALSSVRGQHLYSHDEVLERALQAPESLKEAIGRAAGPAAQMDPDMIMIFGGISSLGGFPSWSIRNSEMYDMGQLGVVTRGKLDAALKRFTRTKQRFGQ